MTYAQLLNALWDMSKDRLEDTITIYDAQDDEFFGVHAMNVAKRDVNDQLDDGHAYLIIKASTEP